MNSLSSAHNLKVNKRANGRTKHAHLRQPNEKTIRSVVESEEIGEKQYKWDNYLDG